MGKKRTRRNKRSSRASKWQRLKSFVTGKAPWFGALLVALGYAAVFAGVVLLYIYVVSPLSLRWKARYGEVPIPEGYSIRGIDISHHQGKIDWKKLSEGNIGGEPISFAFIKATEGSTLVDENFKENFYQAREYGLMRGAYHYFIPNARAESQADHFISQVELEDGDLPPVLDIEEKGNLSTSKLQEEALTWLRCVEKYYGVKPIIYTSYKFKISYLNSKAFSQYPYWIAHYYVQTLTYTGEWKFWQHTDVGRLPGITGNIDFNVYNGSMYDLRKMAIRTDE